MIDMKIVKKYTGDKLFELITLASLGFYMAIIVPNYIMTQGAYAQEKINIELKMDKVNAKIDTNVASLKIDGAKLEFSLLRKEKNEILDIIDDGKAKQRHRDRLEEINDRIKELNNTIKEYEKILVVK